MDSTIQTMSQCGSGPVPNLRRAVQSANRREALPALPTADIGGAEQTSAPTIPAESSVLVDRSRTRRRDGQIFVLRMAEGMEMKRTVRDEGGGWRW